MSTAYRQPRLHYSEKALRQLQGAPTQDCGTHPDTTYARVPKNLRERIGYEWACAECIEVVRKAVAAERQAESAARRAEREQERAARSQARDTATAHLSTLTATLEDGRGKIEAIREAHTEEVVARARAMGEVTEIAAAVTQAEAALLEARQRLAAEKRRLAEAKERVQTPIDSEAYARRAREEALCIEETLAAFDVAADGVRGSAHKKLMSKCGGRAAMKEAAKVIREAHEWAGDLTA